MKHLAMAVLCFESIVLGLSAPVMIMVEDLDPAVGITIGVGLAVACLLAAGLLRTPVGEWLGHAIQVAAIALGFITPIMFVVGLMFAALWGTAVWMGRRIESDRARWAAAEEPPA